MSAGRAVSAVFAVDPSYADLRACQLRIWPDSRIMLWTELVEILRREQKGIDWEPIVIRTFAQNPNAVPYACGKDGKFKGIRFGLDGSQYVSF